MSTIKRVGLVIYDSGASDSDIERGLNAAYDYFKEIGISPSEAFYYIQGWNLDFDEKVDENNVLYVAWENAEQIALLFCFKKVHKIPKDAYLGYKE